LDACRDKDSIESLGIFGIPVVKEKAGVLDQPVFTGQVAGELTCSSSFAILVRAC
jgi:hypothetical protein